MLVDREERGLLQPASALVSCSGNMRRSHSPVLFRAYAKNTERWCYAYDDRYCLAQTFRDVSTIG